MYRIEFKILLITYIAIHGMVPDSICNKTDQSDIHLVSYAAVFSGVTQRY